MAEDRPIASFFGQLLAPVDSPAVTENVKMQGKSTDKEK